jgi:putative ABC transport system permease protein
MYLISLDPVRDGYSPERAAAFFDKLLQRVQQLPSVTAACLTDTVPVAMDGNAGVTFTAGRTIEWARKHVVGRGYFETAEIPILAGRPFRKEDELAGARTVIVSEELVRKLWKGEPLGRQIEIRNGQASGGIGAMPGTIDYRAGALGGERRTYEVVGVAKDVTEDLVVNKKHPAIYFPLHPADYAQPSLRGVTLMLRAVPGVDAVAAVRHEIAAMDSTLSPFNARSMAEQIAQFMSMLKAASWTYGLIGVFALILASVGLAGVTAYSVTQRGHEIGIRLALGAQKRDVMGLVMKEGAVLVTAGTLIGLVLAWAGMQALWGMFFSVASVARNDLTILVGAPLLLSTLAMLACYVPARRSTRIDPVVALRQE